MNILEGRSREIKFSFLGGFLTNMFAFSLIPNEKAWTPKLKLEPGRRWLWICKAKFSGLYAYTVKPGSEKKNPLGFR